MFNLTRIARAAAIAGAVALAGSAHANLVTNGGFETGNFAGWTQFGNTGSTGVTNVARFVHSGTFGGFFGAVSSPGGIFQTLATTAGATYQVSFWLSIDSGNPNSMSFNWDGGAAEMSIVNAPGQAMRQYTFMVTASSASTDLRFNIQHNPAWYGLDDIVVERVNAVPEPGSLLLAGLAIAGVGAASRRKRAA